MLLRADLRKRQTKHKEQHRLKKQTNKYSYKGDEGVFFSLSLFFSVATSERRHSHLRYCNDRVTTLCWSTARWRRLLAASRRFPFFWPAFRLLTPRPVVRTLAFQLAV